MNPHKHHQQAGLTLIEVMIAVLILAVGVIAASGMQTTGLQATRSSQTIQRLNATASSEMALVRGQLRDYTEPTTVACIHNAQNCTVEIRPCTISTNSTLDCTSTSVVSPSAHAVTVAVQEHERTVTLRSVVLR